MFLIWLLNQQNYQLENYLFWRNRLRNGPKILINRPPKHNKIFIEEKKNETLWEFAVVSMDGKTFLDSRKFLLTRNENEGFETNSFHFCACKCCYIDHSISMTFVKCSDIAPSVQVSHDLYVQSLNKKVET